MRKNGCLVLIHSPPFFNLPCVFLSFCSLQPKKAPDPIEKYQRLMKKVNKDGRGMGGQGQPPDTARSEANSVATEGPYSSGGGGSGSGGQYNMGDPRNDMNSSRSAGGDARRPGSDTTGHRESFSSAAR